MQKWFRRIGFENGERSVRFLKMTFTPIDYNNENGKVLSDREKLFENEHKSDVRFEVGPEHDSWSVPAHKHILQATCPALEPFLEQNIVRLRHVDKRAFSTFLK